MNLPALDRGPFLSHISDRKLRRTWSSRREGVELLGSELAGLPGVTLLALVGVDSTAFGWVCKAPGGLWGLLLLWAGTWLIGDKKLIFPGKELLLLQKKWKYL
jgi:hypothetical protein